MARDTDTMSLRTWSALAAALGLAISATGCSTAHAEGQTAAPTGSQAAPSAKADADAQRQMRGIMVPMRDGKSIAADINLPPGDGPFPTIFIHTPYKRENAASPLPDSQFRTELMDREHYAYVVTDWRGFFGSKDAGKGIKSPDHGLDGADVVEWIARQPWSNGKVGMWGHSAPGGVIFRVAAQRPPHLVCAVPSSANLGLSYEQFYYGGVLQKNYLDVLGGVGHSRGGGLALVPRHPTRDAVWQKVEDAIDSATIDIPMLFITGWFDVQTNPKLDTFNDIRTSDKKHGQEMKLIIGPWIHTSFNGEQVGALQFPAAKGVSGRETIRFFDHYLRGLDNGCDREPAIRYFQMSEDTWKSLAQWPPPSPMQSLYLGGGGTLTSTPPGPDVPPDTLVFDPGHPVPTVGGPNIELKSVADPRLRAIGTPAGPYDLRQQVESRSDVLAYTTQELTEPVEVLGTVSVKLAVSSDRTDTDMAVWLADVHPDGTSMLVADGIWRMSFRDSLERPSLMTPGQVYSVTIPLVPTGHTFLKGHRIRLLVSSSNSPRFDVNPNIGKKRLFGPSTLVATNTVHHNAARPSVLLLPVRK